MEADGAVRVIGVDRGGSGFIPVASSTFQEGDIAHMVVARVSLDKLDVLMQPAAD